jgi:hypothetical protein
VQWSRRKYAGDKQEPKLRVQAVDDTAEPKFLDATPTLSFSSRVLKIAPEQIPAAIRSLLEAVSVSAAVR